MTINELPKTYNFKDTEERIYKMWENDGYFKPTNDPNEPDHDPTKKPYVISIPPPNVTGKLPLVGAWLRPRRDRHPTPG